MRARFLINPAAGGGAGRRALPAIRALIPAAARLVVTRDGDHLAAAARQAVADGVERLVVGGGDGTFHLVVPALAGSATCLGLLPLGRGNDLAASLGVPADLAPAVELALAGPERRIDAGRVGDGWFAFYAGAGFDAAVSATADRQARWLPPSITYVLATLRTLAGFRPPRAEIEWDGVDSQGGRFEGEVMFATACIGPLFGGGMRIAPGALMADGLLDLVIVRRVSKLALLRVFPRVFKGTHVEHPAISIHRTPRVRMRFVPPALLASDGEVLGELPGAGIEIGLVPGALRVAAPVPP